MYNRLFTFGCSYTEFIWKTWADIIADDLQIPFQNWGASGTGNIAITSRILECDLKHKFTKDDLIIVNWSSWHRIDLVNEYRYWGCGGNAFNNPMFPPKYLKKYWNQNDDIVKNSTAIILANRNTNIDYQSHMIDYEGKTEYSETSYDFTHYQYYLDNLPKKNIFDTSNNSQFSNTVEDTHPDILTHLNHVQQVYKHLNLTINPSTVKKYSDMQDTIINTINNNGNILSALDWDQMRAFFKGVAL
jgi:hypothetical protein|tara:strand:- start:722 stop:1456 length:735 start_codon:yes stop_codon:yes gene_type:complete